MSSTTATTAVNLQQFVEDNIQGLAVHTTDQFRKMAVEIAEDREDRRDFEERMERLLRDAKQLKEGYESGSKPDDENLRRKVSELEAKLNGIDTVTNNNTKVLKDVANQVNQLGNAFTSQCAQTAALLERIANRFDGVEAKVAGIVTEVVGIKEDVEKHKNRINTVEECYGRLSKIAEDNREAIAKLPPRYAQQSQQPHQSDPVDRYLDRMIKYQQAQCVMNALQSASASGATSQCNVISALMTLQ